jgi:Spy/CpxP family protein refolding chaperone
MSFGVSGVSPSVYLATTATIAANTLAAPATTTQAPVDPFADPNGPFSNLNLTAQQQQQIQQIFSQNPQSGSQTPTQLFQAVDAVLTPQQQQTLKTDLETLSAHHHHHHHSDSSSNSLLSQLDLSSSQQSQINQILQTAQAAGTTPSNVLSQIDNVLTPTQQQQLVSLLSANNPTGSTATSTQPLVVNTNA